MYTPQNITILLITLASFFPLYGQNKDNDQDLELVKVASLNTIEANKEFQKNVQLVQQQRALAVQILSKLEKVQDKDEHDELQKQLNSLQKKLNDNNQNLRFYSQSKLCAYCGEGSCTHVGNQRRSNSN